jgi:26S proteasome regulatory subunit N11
MVVGWYHSHPGFGCWLSSVDIHTQQTFEMMNSRAVAVVVDPIQSVKGKVVIDAFRTIPSTTVVMGVEPRQTTSNIGHIKKPSIQALIHGLNRHYYSIAVNYRKTELEQTMLMNLHKQNWTSALKLRDFSEHKSQNEKSIKVSHRCVGKFDIFANIVILTSNMSILATGHWGCVPSISRCCPYQKHTISPSKKK